MQHDRRDLGGVGQISDAGFDDLDPGGGDVLLDLALDALCHHFRGAAQAALIGHTIAGGVHVGSHIVGVDAHHVAQGAVTLQGQVFFVVVHIEHGLCGVGHPPDHRNADLHRVAQAIVDLLAGVVQGHHLQGDLLAVLLTVSLHHRALLNITALAQDGACGGVDRRAEGIDPVKALPLQGADVITEQGQHQRFLGLEDFQAREQENTDDGIDDSDRQRDKTQEGGIQHYKTDAAHHNRSHITQQGQQKHGHAVLLGL